MATKKQLEALKRGRENRKTKNKKVSKRITKAEYKEPTKMIIYNGEPMEIPLSKLPKKKSKWNKIGRYAKNAAIAAATLGAIGYGAYRGKDIYNKYLHYPVDYTVKGGKLIYHLLNGDNKVVIL